MVICPNPDCLKTIDDSEAFCPHCGTDNRPPESRREVVACDHQAPRIGPYCTKCGEPLSNFYGRQVQRNPRQGWALMFTGIAGTVLALYFTATLFVDLPGSQLTLGLSIDARFTLLKWIILFVVAGFWPVGIIGYCKVRGSRKLIDENFLRDDRLSSGAPIRERDREFWN